MNGYAGKSMASSRGDWRPCPALYSKVPIADRKDSQNLANANYGDVWLLWQPAVKDAERRNGINGGDPPKAGSRPFMPASRILEGRLPEQHSRAHVFSAGSDNPNAAKAAGEKSGASPSPFRRF